jgi:hypothetical protein
MCVCASVTLPYLQSSLGGSGEASPAIFRDSTNEGAPDAGIARTVNDQNGEGAEVAHWHSAWEMTAKAVVASIASLGCGLRVLELRFYRRTRLRRPALMSLCVLTGLGKLCICRE